MITAVTNDNLENLSDDALWELFVKTHAMLEELPYGSWERGLAMANLRTILGIMDRRRLSVAAAFPG